MIKSASVPRKKSIALVKPNHSQSGAVVTCAPNRIKYADEILALHAQGLGPRDIARKLTLKPYQVSQRLTRLRKKGIEVKVNVSPPERQISQSTVNRIVEMAISGDFPHEIADKLTLDPAYVRGLLSALRKSNSKIPRFDTVVMPGTQSTAEFATDGKSLDEIARLIEKDKELVSKRLISARKHGIDVPRFKPGSKSQLHKSPAVLLAQEGVKARDIARKLIRPVKSVQSELTRARQQGIFVPYEQSARHAKYLQEYMRREEEKRAQPVTRVTIKRKIKPVRTPSKLEIKKSARDLRRRVFAFTKVARLQPHINRFNGSPTQKLIAFVNSECFNGRVTYSVIESAVSRFSRITNLPIKESRMIVNAVANYVLFVNVHSKRGK